MSDIFNLYNIISFINYTISISDKTQILAYAGIFGVIANIGMYSINRRTFKLLYNKPKIEIIQKSLAPEIKNGMGGFEQRCFIKYRITNPSATNTLITKEYILIIGLGCFYKHTKMAKPNNRSESVQPFGEAILEINVDYEKIKHINYCLVVISTKDIKQSTSVICAFTKIKKET